ncbi:hypothetical protein PENSPDRAFT_659071 [Peniophora sp. CONT]|nr:hypothetical protein PENSPDRAFT_659071 [Peniophora sp. CONT]
MTAPRSSSTYTIGYISPVRDNKLGLFITYALSYVYVFTTYVYTSIAPAHRNRSCFTLAARPSRHSHPSDDGVARVYTARSIVVRRARTM